MPFVIGQILFCLIDNCQQLGSLAVSCVTQREIISRHILGKTRFCNIAEYCLGFLSLQGSLVQSDLKGSGTISRAWQI